jgi:hypothetical protein
MTGQKMKRDSRDSVVGRVALFRSSIPGRDKKLFSAPKRQDCHYASLNLISVGSGGFFLGG